MHQCRVHTKCMNGVDWRQCERRRCFQWVRFVRAECCGSARVVWTSSVISLSSITADTRVSTRCVLSSPFCPLLMGVTKHRKLLKLEMWANAQRDGRPAEYRWRPLFNATRSLSDTHYCLAVTLQDAKPVEICLGDSNSPTDLSR